MLFTCIVRARTYFFFLGCLAGLVVAGSQKTIVSKTNGKTIEIVYMPSQSATKSGEKTTERDTAFDHAVEICR